MSAAATSSSIIFKNAFFFFHWPGRGGRTGMESNAALDLATFSRPA
jgi:hypothetical protein